jgi:hypothetical protein
MKLVEQDPAERLQDAAGLNDPPDAENTTTPPDGVMGVPADVASDTVAVQVAGAFTGTEEGVQLTEMEL